MQQESLTVGLGQRAYDIVIGPDLLNMNSKPINKFPNKLLIFLFKDLIFLIL